MKKLQLLLSLALLSAACLLHAEPVALFYLTSSPDSIRSFLAHSSQIDLLVPTWYQVDENGLVTGAPDPTVLKRAGEDKVPVMPIIAMFNKKGFHVLAIECRCPGDHERGHDPRVQAARVYRLSIRLRKR